MASVSPGKNYLLKLPSELRNDIFRLAFVQDTPIQIIRWHDPNPDERVRSITPQPLMAATCKQFRAEILSIYYAENSFYLDQDLYSSKNQHTSDSELLNRWVLAAKQFGRFLTSIEFAHYCGDFTVLKCTDHVEEREGGTTKFRPYQVNLAATRASSSDGHASRLEFKIAASGRFFEGSYEGIDPEYYRYRKGITMCVCDAELARSVHQDETCLKHDVRDVELLNGMLQRISRISTARSVEICSCYRMLMLGP